MHKLVNTGRLGVTVSSRKWLFASMALLFWAGILLATLYPFQFHPSNDVTWIAGPNGLRFGRHGIVLSEENLFPEQGKDDFACAIEVLLKPASLGDVSTFLVLSSASHQGQIRIQQYLSGLIIWRDFPDAGGRARSAKRDVDYFFISGKTMLLTLSSGPKGLSVYSNGQLLDRFPNYFLPRGDLSGRLVFGTNPAHIDTWSGELLGLALYDHELQPAQVADHYKVWNSGQPKQAENAGDHGALFLFDERTGKAVHNSALHGANLAIPSFFVLPDKPFLAPPWKEFSWGPDYFNDVLRNIIGFIPLGFTLCGFLSLSPLKHRAFLVTVLFGAATSLSIEILQAFIPFRESGLTDVLTNTTGTALGALLASHALGNLLREQRTPSPQA